MMIKETENKENLPYERCMAYGCQALTDTELLSVLLRTGTRDCSVLNLAQIVLKGGGENRLHRLMDLHYHELLEIKGIGRVKAIQILCLVELAKRLWKSSKGGADCFDSPQAVADYYMQEMRSLHREELRLALLDTRQGLLSDILLSRGTVNASIISIREVLAEALRHGAVNVVLVHNHPSGNPLPSKEDFTVTEGLKKACDLVGIRLNDHVIIGDNQYYSFREQGAL